ncbi:hypothetical protein, partial [Raoultella lignicola]
MCANIFPEAAHGACPGYNIAACSPVSAAPPGPCCRNIFPEAARGACPGYSITACSPVSAAPP